VSKPFAGVIAPDTEPVVKDVLYTHLQLICRQARSWSARVVPGGCLGQFSPARCLVRREWRSICLYTNTISFLFGLLGTGVSHAFLNSPQAATRTA